MIKLPESVLSTYEQERRPIAYINLTKAEENAKALIDLSLELSSEEYPQAYAKLSRKHALSAGIGMGYAYFDSSLVSCIMVSLQSLWSSQNMILKIYLDISYLI
ncbi:hypothetical protein fh0823_04350 [Francisella halioticida]|uniref:Uncharacterized protein n=1 Tax=Francisella halioticida TaxID=549298 RepID=A0ABM6LYY6_9GAMM|nr:hypothetical protein [Francisella halioticida]ASG67716.1 hypothetical protein CDV26_04290 [Francisella halioticida]BCD90296.1 hypothetical protein fh0823_04350 [Francisella halioticida]